MPAYKDYTLGKGEVYFDNGTGERYLGNTTVFNVTVESETLDHFDSDEGIRVKDDSTILEVNRTGTITTDNISIENVALFLMGDMSTVTQAATPVVDEEIDGVLEGRFYQLGKTTNNPQGVRGVTAVTVEIAPSTLAVLNTDYTLDAAMGRIYIVEGGAIDDGDDLLVSYTPVANSRQRVATNNNASLSGALRFIAKNPKGTSRDWYMPQVTLRPEGDFALKGDDWIAMNFAVEIGAPSGQSAIYVDGRPL
jgi:hypothetical protein